MTDKQRFSTLANIGTFVRGIAAGVVVLIAAATFFYGKPKTVFKEFDRYHRNGHCVERATDVRSMWRVEATEGWRIDFESVAVRITTQSTNSSYGGVEEIGDGEGFYVLGSVVNNGECVYVLDQRIAKDARGALGISGTYTETQDRWFADLF